MLDILKVIWVFLNTPITHLFKRVDEAHQPMMEARVNKPGSKVDRALARTVWRNLSCKRRKQIKDSFGNRGSFATYRKVM